MSIMSLHPAESPALRLFQHPDPAAALGLAVSHLMTKPAFARLPFGAWSKVLVGQINRKTYYLVLDATGRTTGFLGWAITHETPAEAWLAGSADHGHETGDGDCVIVNAWSAETAQVNQLLLKALQHRAAGMRLVYFRRHYPDGRTRNSRMTVPALVPIGPAAQTQRKIA
jgi:hemolysin-activating ACP:hemolysin acyltransferase